MFAKLSTRATLSIASAAIGAILFSQTCYANNNNYTGQITSIFLYPAAPNVGVCFYTPNTGTSAVCVDGTGQYDLQNQIIIDAYKNTPQAKTCSIQWGNTKTAGYSGYSYLPLTFIQCY